MNTITLTTDFGLRDWFVGTMKGVILNIHPEATVVDIAHEVEPGKIRSGSFALASAYGFFPKGTVHVGVVDPGVGTEREAVVIETERYCFVGPDNGLFSYALRNETIVRIHRLENPQFFVHPVSRTFHGRDIFAPVAAHLVRGVPVHRFGPPQDERDLVRLEWTEPESMERGWKGAVMYIDHFGNVITNLPSHLAKPPLETWQVETGNHSVCGIYSNYQLIPRGKPGAVPGSAGFLEIAVHQGNAAAEYHLGPGETVYLEKKN